MKQQRVKQNAVAFFPLAGPYLGARGASLIEALATRARPKRNRPAARKQKQRATKRRLVAVGKLRQRCQLPPSRTVSLFANVTAQTISCST